MWEWLKNLMGRDEPETPRQVTVHNLGLGDIVLYLDASYVVHQKIVNHAHGFIWHDYKLGGGDETNLWLSVEDDDELVIALYQPIGLEVSADPESTLTYEGVTYTLEEKVTADAKITRRSGNETRTKAESWDYEGSDGSLLGIQRWGGSETEVMHGRRIPESSLELMAKPSTEG